MFDDLSCWTVWAICIWFWLDIWEIKDIWYSLAFLRILGILIYNPTSLKEKWQKCMFMCCAFYLRSLVFAFSMFPFEFRLTLYNLTFFFFLGNEDKFSVWEAYTILLRFNVAYIFIYIFLNSNLKLWYLWDSVLIVGIVIMNYFWVCNFEYVSSCYHFTETCGWKNWILLLRIVIKSAYFLNLKSGLLFWGSLSS